ncbi:sulfatase family protein [Flavicella sediminum]|uniref:sulfatase family protein n=1 Tax=Flavicella sediminum TaxID=2585141 RepID=UPI00112337CF|nr:arylsulfatase [Flavicella sediminum]
MNNKFTIVVLFSMLIATNLASAQNTKQPNVIIIYGDDVGYGDVGAYGSKMIPTPNIDKLAKEGLRFTDGHCTAATCTPSRYAMMTGVHAFRNKVNILPPNAPLTFPTDVLTLPKVFQKAGYTTGVIGKWHLGLGEKGVYTDWNNEVKPGPLEVGFDSCFLLPSTNDRVPCVYLEGHKVVGLSKKDPLYVSREFAEVQGKNNTEYENGVTNPEAMTYYRNTGNQHNNTVVNGIGRIGYMSGGQSALWNDEGMADVFVKEVKKYIKKNRKKPFFLYYSVQDIHVPRAPHKRFQGKTELGYRGDAMVQFDWATGEVLKTLEKYGLSENTIVIFSSDNGPAYDNGYLDGTTITDSYGENDRGHDASGIYRGGKAQIYEGGTRVPFIVKWPGHIKPGVSDAVVSQIDFIASFSEFFNQEITENQARDSRNSLDAFLGIDTKGLLYLFEEHRRRKALRIGDWKYIIGAAKKRKDLGPELYNLKLDPGEQNNVAFLNPTIVEEMHEKLLKIIHKK